MDEARTVIRRLERIEALQTAKAPAAQLLAEVRQLLSEGEAWLAAEKQETSAEPHGATQEAAAALAGCRGTFARREEVVPETAGSATL